MNETLVLVAAFALICLAAHRVGRWFTAVGLPYITGYLAVGAAVGTFGLDLIPTAAAEQLRAAQIAENERQQEQTAIERELASLRTRTSQIPAQNLRLRARILDALTIAEADVPFVGELLKVKESEGEWEGAIERLLHNFGLRLLVPERTMIGLPAMSAKTI